MRLFSLSAWNSISFFIDSRSKIGGIKPSFFMAKAILPFFAGMVFCAIFFKGFWENNRASYIRSCLTMNTPLTKTLVYNCTKAK